MVAVGAGEDMAVDADSAGGAVSGTSVLSGSRLRGQI